MAASGTRNVTAVCIHSVVCHDSRLKLGPFDGKSNGILGCETRPNPLDDPLDEDLGQSAQSAETRTGFSVDSAWRAFAPSVGGPPTCWGRASGGPRYWPCGGIATACRKVAADPARAEGDADVAQGSATWVEVQVRYWPSRLRSRPATGSRATGWWTPRRTCSIPSGGRILKPHAEVPALVGFVIPSARVTHRGRFRHG
jgi:hypothetical protein